MFTFHKKVPQKIQQILRNAEDSVYNKSFFHKGSFRWDRDTSLKYFDDNFEVEMNLLEKILLIEDNLSLNFYPSNWPRGYRYESNFLAFKVFDMKVSDMVYKYFYKIKIEEDTLDRKRHKVFFLFPPTMQETPIEDVIMKIGKKIKCSEISINYELELLCALSHDEMDLIGNKFVEKDIIETDIQEKEEDTYDCNLGFNEKLLNGYLKLLKVKHSFYLLKRIKTSGLSIVEGVIHFQPIYKSKFSMVFRDIEKYFLHIHLCNANLNKVHFCILEKKYSLSEILNFAGIITDNNLNEVELLVSFTNYDLNIISMLLEDMMTTW